MTASDTLIKQCEDALAHETLSEDTLRVLRVLFVAYREQVKASLRLEETIHSLRK